MGSPPPTMGAPPPRMGMQPPGGGPPRPGPPGPPQMQQPPMPPQQQAPPAPPVAQLQGLAVDSGSAASSRPRAHIQRRLYAQNEQPDVSDPGGPVGQNGGHEPNYHTPAAAARPKAVLQLCFALTSAAGVPQPVPQPYRSRGQRSEGLHRALQQSASQSWDRFIDFAHALIRFFRATLDYAVAAS